MRGRNASSGEENAKGRDRKKQRPTQDRILRRSIKSWQVQSFLWDDPGNGRAVALLIPLPAANFSPSPSFFFSSPDPLHARPPLVPSFLLVLSLVTHVPCISPYTRTSFYVPPAFLIRFCSCIMRYATVILSPCLITRAPLCSFASISEERGTFLLASHDACNTY